MGKAIRFYRDKLGFEIYEEFEHRFNIIVPSYANTTVNNKFMSAEQSYKYHKEFMWNRRYAECISLYETIKRMNS